MSTAKIAVITGANRGIGLAVCQTLAATISTPLVLYAVSRTGTNLGILPSSAAVSVEYGKISLTDRASITALVARVEQEHGGCDVLINNAGVYHYATDLTHAQRTEILDVNYRGTLAVCQGFLPIMRKGGRIANVSSASGGLAQFSPNLRERFRDPGNTLEDVEKLIQEYEQLAIRGKAVEGGWARKPYFVSKAAENAMTMALARSNPGFFINCCCPGWVSTDLGNQAGAAPKTVEQGARVPIRVGFGDIGGVTGKYWANDEIWESGEGSVQDW